MILIDNLIDAFYRKVERIIESKGAPSLEEYFETRGEIENDSNIRVLNDIHLSSISAGNSSLLTHVSALIAACGVLLIVFEEEKFTALLILFDILLYAVIALIIIMNISYHKTIPSKGTTSSDVQRQTYERYLRQRYIYQNCIKLNIVVTLLFIFTILIHIFVILLR